MIVLVLNSYGGNPMSLQRSQADFIKRYTNRTSLTITVDDADKMYLAVGKGLTLNWLFSSPSCQTGELRTTYFVGTVRHKQLVELYEAVVALQEIGQTIHIA